MLHSLSKSISNLNRWIGDKLSWLSLILVLLICLDVLFRYLFSSTQTWIIELEWHLFALMFLLSAAATFEQNEHVRVDLFYNRYSKKTKAYFNLACTLFLLIPWCVVIIMTSFNYGLNSLYMNEGSPNPGGLPARYIIKFCICLGFILLLLQAIAYSIDSFRNLKSDSIE